MRIDQVDPLVDELPAARRPRDRRATRARSRADRHDRIVPAGTSTRPYRSDKTRRRASSRAGWKRWLKPTRATSPRAAASSAMRRAFRDLRLRASRRARAARTECGQRQRGSSPMGCRDDDQLDPADDRSPARRSSCSDFTCARNGVLYQFSRTARVGVDTRPQAAAPAGSAAARLGRRVRTRGSRRRLSRVVPRGVDLAEQSAVDPPHLEPGAQYGRVELRRVVPSRTQKPTGDLFRLFRQQIANQREDRLDRRWVLHVVRSSVRTVLARQRPRRARSPPA